ncbi:hypothetical protein T265_07930 [Opisthorchis viverrini]|uniref:Ig-like domain-containing protein n=1 Tax=Opisthorchis viverrini TaxID=6198 RepID=A0A074ZLX8_OPIVI|nr:hypothetical protein T265_07930 [Opisthorchis viverrini]KER24370.1 hypothetical protein T265_07930 [Opisthorchis viverrini]
MYRTFLSLTNREKHSIPDLRVNARGTVSITQASSIHAGKYECAVVAGVNTAKSSAFLLVATQPAIPILRPMNSDRPLSSPKEGNLQAFVCTCPVVYPRPKLIWIISPVRVNETSAVRQLQNEPSRTFIYEPDKRTFDGLLSSELRINLSWTDHAAELGCKAINSVGASISQRIKLKVELYLNNDSAFGKIVRNLSLPIRVQGACVNTKEELVAAWGESLHNSADGRGLHVFYDKIVWYSVSFIRPYRVAELVGPTFQCVKTQIS